jgi:hypothetical protein
MTEGKIVIPNILKKKKLAMMKILTKELLISAKRPKNPLKIQKEREKTKEITMFKLIT